MQQDLTVLLSKIDNALGAIEADRSNATTHSLSLAEHLQAFQLQPQLLDVKLDRLVKSASRGLLESAEWASRIIYTLSVVRGPKIVASMMPNAADLLPRIANLLRTVSPDPSGWMRRYSLLLWLSILVLQPFPLHAYSFENEDFSATLQSLVASFLDVPSKESQAASITLARLLARSDNAESRERFVDLCIRTVETMPLTKADAHMSAVASLLKLVDTAPKSLGNLVEMSMRVTEARRGTTISHKNCIKVLSRSALLAISLEDVDIDLESIVSRLLDSLGHSSGMVRFSSAKSLARIASRLSFDPELQCHLTDTVLSILLTSSSSTSHDMCNGALLCVAEMLRRNLLRDQLAQIVDILKMALFFDRAKLTYSVGASVRDAGCYVCWSLVRVQTLPVNLSREIMILLVVVCCFDRELNVRRAASAALQEAVGRQTGMLDIEHAINIVQNLSFFSVSSMQNAFLECSQAAYKYPLFQSQLRDRAIAQLSSWDINVRCLAAKALSLLLLSDDIQVRQKVTKTVRDKFTNSNPEVDHGVMMAMRALKEDSSIADLVSKENLLGEDANLYSEGFVMLLRNRLHLTNDHLQTLMEIMAFDYPSVVEQVCLLVSERQMSTFEPFLDAWLQNVPKGGSFTLALGSLQPDKEKDGFGSVKKVVDCLVEILGRNSVRYTKSVKPEQRCEAVIALYNLTTGWNIHGNDIETAYLRGLDDYSVDVRGDVGSWTRSKVMDVLKVGGNENSHSSTFLCEYRKRLLRMSVEPLGKLRKKAREALNVSNSFESVLELTPSCSPEELRFLCIGLVASCGAQNVDDETLSSSLDAVSACNDRRIPNTFVDLLKSKGKTGMNAIRACTRIAEYGYEYDGEQMRLIIAHCGTILQDAHASSNKISWTIKLLQAIGEQDPKESTSVLSEFLNRVHSIQAGEALCEILWAHDLETHGLENFDWKSNDTVALHGFLEKIKAQFS